MLALGGASLLVLSLVAAWDTLSSRLHALARPDQHMSEVFT